MGRKVGGERGVGGRVGSVLKGLGVTVGTLVLAAAHNIINFILFHF